MAENQKLNGSMALCKRIYYLVAEAIITMREANAKGVAGVISGSEFVDKEKLFGYNAMRVSGQIAGYAGQSERVKVATLNEVLRNLEEIVQKGEIVVDSHTLEQFITTNSIIRRAVRDGSRVIAAGKRKVSIARGNAAFSDLSAYTQEKNAIDMGPLANRPGGVQTYSWGWPYTDSYLPDDYIPPNPDEFVAPIISQISDHR